MRLDKISDFYESVTFFNVFIFGVISAVIIAVLLIFITHVVKEMNDRDLLFSAFLFFVAPTMYKDIVL